MTMTQLLVASLVAGLSVPFVRGVSLYVLQRYFGIGRNKNEQAADKWIQYLIALPIALGIFLSFHYYFTAQG